MAVSVARSPLLHSLIFKLQQSADVAANEGLLFSSLHITPSRPRESPNSPSLRASDERFPYSLPVSSETAGVVSTARIERPLLYRGGSASTETIPAVSPLHFQSSLAHLSTGQPDRSSIARVERGPSDPLHFALRGAARQFFTARIEGAHSYRARSTSRRTTRLLSPHFRL